VTTDDPRIRRVVATLDLAAAPGQVLEAAARLANALNAELVGLFVEDQRLLRVAALPFAQEFGLATARARPLGVGDLERALRRQADRMRRVLADLAQPLGLAWRLEVVRGDSLQSALAYVGAEDLLVIGRARYLAGDSRRVAGGFGRVTDAVVRMRPVAVCFDDTPQSVRALAFAASLARAAGTDTTVLIPATGPEHFRARRLEAGRLLQARGASAAAYAMLPDPGPASVERAVREQRVSVLVWPVEDRRGAATEAARLLVAVTCPVVMIG